MPRWAEGPAPSPRARSSAPKSAVANGKRVELMDSWAQLGNNALLNTLALVLAAGGAMLLGKTRNGDAFLIRVWLGGDTYEDYVSSVAEWDAVMEVHRDTAEALMMRGPREAP